MHGVAEVGLDGAKGLLQAFEITKAVARGTLEMGLDAAGKAGGLPDADALLEGSVATQKLLLQTLDRFGVQSLDPVGEPFDPEFHEAMTMQPSVDAEPGSVLAVIQKGYMLNGRLLRPARVVVAAEPAEGG